MLRPDNLDVLELMPYSCAYRLVHEGRSIDESPLELSVKGKVVSEEYIHDDQLPEHIVDWIRADGESQAG